MKTKTNKQQQQQINNNHRSTLSIDWNQDPEHQKKNAYMLRNKLQTIVDRIVYT